MIVLLLLKGIQYECTFSYFDYPLYSNIGVEKNNSIRQKKTELRSRILSTRGQDEKKTFKVNFSAVNIQVHFNFFSIGY